MDFFETDILLLLAAPQLFDEDIVQASSPAIRRDTYDPSLSVMIQVQAGNRDL